MTQTQSATTDDWLQGGTLMDFSLFCALRKLEDQEFRWWETSAIEHWLNLEGNYK